MRIGRIFGASGGPARRPLTVLSIACAVHFVHDGFSDALYVLFPIWAAGLHLTFAQVGIVRAVYSGGMAIFQVPAGLLAERWGEKWLLAVGTALTASSFISVGRVEGFGMLLLFLALGGLGSGVQHPLGSSIVSKEFEAGGQRTALGTYNFAGDLGKISIPSGVALGVVYLGWRQSVTVCGLLGLVAAITLLLIFKASHVAAPEKQRVTHAGRWGIRDHRAFSALGAIGLIDYTTRTGFLTFLPFLLIAKGLDVGGIGTALALVFAGGAAGKFVCGLVAERLGIIRTVILTEAATALGIIAVVVLPLFSVQILLLPLGIALNGTSSVLYATVAELVDPDRRSRTYGLYYTIMLASAAIAPSFYGVLSDVAGVATAMAIMGILATVTIPLSFVLQRSVRLEASA